MILFTSCRLIWKILSLPCSIPPTLPLPLFFSFLSYPLLLLLFLLPSCPCLHIPSSNYVFHSLFILFPFPSPPSTLHSLLPLFLFSCLDGVFWQPRRGQVAAAGGACSWVNACAPGWCIWNKQHGKRRCVLQSILFIIILCCVVLSYPALSHPVLSYPEIKWMRYRGYGGSETGLDASR